MKSACLVIIVLMTLLNQCSSLPPPNSTPLDWTGNAYSSACQTMGVTQIAEDQSSVVSYYIYLKSSYTYYQFTNNDGQGATSQKLFKYYIQLENNGQIQTHLQIQLISRDDGSKITQLFLIQNTYEFIDADGPYCLLKQTDSGGNNLLTLYKLNDTLGATTLLQLTSVSLSTYPNEIFKSLSVSYVNYYNDNNLANIYGTIFSINTITSQAFVRKISSTGLVSTQLYKFTMSDINSEVYTNLLLGLEIIGSNFYTYVGPVYNTISAPYVYTNSQTAIQTSSGLFSNHIVIPFLQSMMVATYDDNGQNGNIFFLRNFWYTYALSLINMKTTLAAPAGSLQYLTDHSSYIIELNLDPTVSTFYIIWADYQNMQNITFMNSLGDNRNSQIIEDFSNHPKISSLVLSQYFSDGTFKSDLSLWIYNPTKIVKYILQESKNSAGAILSITINKLFTAELLNNLLVNSIGPNFQVATTQLKCECHNPELIDMNCFSNADKCVFTVQTFYAYCNPIAN